MLFSSSITAALLATASLAVASPAQIKRATGPINFVNKTPSTINYALVGPKGVVSTGVAQRGNTYFPLPPAGEGYSLKLSTGNPQASSGILQFEYSLNSDNNIYYDWSARNGNPDPFAKYNRSIVPYHESGSCKAIYCSEGEQDTKCESTSAGQGPIGVCPATSGVIFSVEIEGP